MVWRKRMPLIERDGEWELERFLLLEWGKSGHPRFMGINSDQNWMMMMNNNSIDGSSSK